MGRELRRVPADWQHPRIDDRPDSWQPLYDEDFETAGARWWNAKQVWERREDPLATPADYEGYTFEEWHGEPPDPAYYRPAWPEETRTHYQMYETTTEGTPISPVFADIESLAHWLADNGASAFGDMTATYEQWLAMCQSGWAPSGVVSGGILQSGVAAALTADALRP